MKKLLCTALIGMVIMSGGCGQGLKEAAKEGFNSTYKPNTVEETVEKREDEEIEEPSIDEYLSTLSEKYIYEDSEMSIENLSQNTSVTYSEENRTIEIDINLTMSGNDVDVYGYIEALIDGQYPDTIQDMCDISIKEVNEASDMAYELGFHELPAHTSCTIFIKDVPIAGAFQGIEDDEPKVYYRIDEDK